MPFLDFSAKMTRQYLCDKRHSVTGLFQAHFLHSSLRSLLHVVGLSTAPSFFPLTGSCMTKMIKRTATIPITGVTRSPHLQDPNKLAVPDPTIYPRPLENNNNNNNNNKRINQTLQNITVLQTKTTTHVVRNKYAYV